MLLSDYDFDLPQELIAQHPLENRSASRLLHLRRANNEITHKQFSDLSGLLTPGDVLVRNETRVIPARLLGQKVSGGKVEVLLVRVVNAETNVWKCMTRSSKSLKNGSFVNFPKGISGEVVDSCEDGCRLIRFSGVDDFCAALEQVGHMPLPPYIKREDLDMDRDRYQTVFANNPGAIAAPTAGLHFTEECFETLTEMDVKVCGVTLHVGPGTFLPVRVNDLKDHQMHSEQYEIPQNTVDIVNQARTEGRRIIALGTTVVRTLEAAVDDQGILQPGQGETELFIKPGFHFRSVDALITNFHLPKSTLLVLVSAFSGHDFILSAYREAVKSGYRFFSYGDCMLIE